MFGMDPAAVRLPEAIRLAGYAPEQVTHVLLTHLHFDHCGWSTRRSPAGGSQELVPTFPNATYWLEAGEVEHARHPNERDRASYDPRNWEPLFAAGVVRLFDGDAGAEPLPGVRAVRVPGHNADMCIVLLDGREGAEAAAGDGGVGGEAEAGTELGDRGVFFADLVPTVAHVAYPWIMGYDSFPLTTLENKKVWLPRAAAGGWLAVFQHEAETPLGRVVEEKPGRFRAVPLTVAAPVAVAAGR
jgi:glyoxylase-like metal-dependent hydrolase (beta-lactamase superfamily II)